MTTLYSLFISCENEPVESDTKSIENLKVIDGTIQFDSRASLKNVATMYQKNVEGQNEFNSMIKSFQKNGFKPLEPIFEENDSEKIKTFITEKRQRLIQRDKDFGIISNYNSKTDIDLEDDIIADPMFRNLLNVNREIYVADSIYKYTEMGLFFCSKKNKQVLYDYLKKMTPAQRMAQVRNNNKLSSKSCNPQQRIQNLGDGISLFTRIAPTTCGGGTQIGNPIPPAPYVPAVFNPDSFGICTIESQGFWEKIFGTSEKCEDYYSDNRRVQTSFWNQNFLVYASIGTSVRLQKHEEYWLASWWEKSYADTIQLAVNSVTYTYNYNVPIFNMAAYNYSTTFFEFNGTKYNINGQVIPTVPTGSGNFAFSENNAGNVIDITVLGADIALNNGQVNKYIDQALKELTSKMQNAYDKIKLENAIVKKDLKVNILYAVPFSNSVKFITANVAWRENSQNQISNYFDFNFKFTWKSNYSGYSDYLNGLNGAESYTSVLADVYGAALHNNEWRGKRMIYQQ